MAIRQIREENDEILRKTSRKIEVIDDRIIELVKDMEETMRKFNGVGLAAVQVGVLKRLVIIDVDDGEGLRVFINPEIIKTKGTQEVEEGCLSFPNQFGKVVRPLEVTVEALDLKGNKFTLKAKDLLAQAIAHEVDHLNGILFVDNVIEGTLEYVEQNQNK